MRRLVVLFMESHLHAGQDSKGEFGARGLIGFKIAVGISAMIPPNTAVTSPNGIGRGWASWESRGALPAVEVAWHGVNEFFPVNLNERRPRPSVILMAT